MKISDLEQELETIKKITGDIEVRTTYQLAGQEKNRPTTAIEIGTDKHGNKVVEII